MAPFTGDTPRVRLELFFNREPKGVVWLPHMQTADVVSEIVYETV
ncbi:MAG: hypothetical protein WBB99_20610 [Rhodococcus sp. (in: high G+C Gram-positive bacteria)]